MRALPAITGRSQEPPLQRNILHRAGTSAHAHARQLHLSSLSDTGLSQLASSSSTDLTRRPAYLARVSVPDPCFAADSHRRSHSPLDDEQQRQRRARIGKGTRW